jgi:hypothetical protein
MDKHVNPTRWLWWAALVILGLGLAFIGLLYSTRPPGPSFSPEMRMVAMSAIVLVGVCIISATAQWWTHR